MASDPDTTTLKPTFEKPEQVNVSSSYEFRSIHWTLNGPLEDSVFLRLEEGSHGQPMASYYEKKLDGTCWHAISDKAVSDPPVSTLVVDILQLEEWAECWDELHGDCPGGVWQDADGNKREEEEEDEGEEGEFDRDTFDTLIRCCDQDRPPESIMFEVRASKQPFVTVHDYLKVVHPWLMGQRDLLLLVLNPTIDPDPLPEDTKLTVDKLSPTTLSIKDDYDERRHKMTTPPPTAPDDAVTMEKDISGTTPPPGTPPYQRIIIFTSEEDIWASHPGEVIDCDIESKD